MGPFPVVQIDVLTYGASGVSDRLVRRQVDLFALNRKDR